ncbi:MAG: hypothetical protein NTY67_03515 [Cyanobacteria bacterium]|jgi:hypothetical protein|nr:hypothetical protein [Cyanobacteriota bacterium]
MPAIPDRHYNAACGRLASQLGISLASARRKVDIRAVRDGIPDTSGKVALAVLMVEEAQASGVDAGAMLTAQLGTVGSDELFMTED